MIYSAKNQALNPDELRCDSNQLGRIIEHLRAHPTTRVNIHLTQKDSIDTLKHEISILSKVTTNYTVSCDRFAQLQECLHSSIPAYFNFPVTDWETFMSLIEWGVSDILIDGPLGFQMDAIKSKKGSTLIRVRPQESPNAAISLGDNENSFFIRPEDVDTYAPYIDILEIFSDNKEQEEVIYKTYKRKYFKNDLSILVKQLKVSVPNPFIRPDFAEKRLNCGQACKGARSSSCRRCYRNLYLTNLVLNYFKPNQENAIE